EVCAIESDWFINDRPKSLVFELVLDVSCSTASGRSTGRRSSRPTGRHWPCTKGTCWTAWTGPATAGCTTRARRFQVVPQQRRDISDALVGDLLSFSAARGPRCRIGETLRSGGAPRPHRPASAQGRRTRLT